MVNISCWIYPRDPFSLNTLFQLPDSHVGLRCSRQEELKENSCCRASGEAQSKRLLQPLQKWRINPFPALSQGFWLSFVFRGGIGVGFTKRLKDTQSILTIIDPTSIIPWLYKPHPDSPNGLQPLWKTVPNPSLVVPKLVSHSGVAHPKDLQLHVRTGKNYNTDNILADLWMLLSLHTQFLSPPGDDFMFYEGIFYATGVRV